MPFDTDLSVTSVNPRDWILNEDLVYTGSKGDTIVVPRGTTTDFASVPTLLQSFMPRTGAWTKAAVVHDYLIEELANAWGDPLGPGPMISSLDTDGIFRRIMDEEGTGFIRRWLAWAAVRWASLVSAHRRQGWFTPAPLAALLAITVVTLATVFAVLALVAKVVPW